MNACAYVVGPRDGPGAALIELAKGLGFETVLPYGGLALAEQQVQQTPLCFFLFAAVPDVRSLKSVADAIRFCPKSKVRFSPLIYFDESPSAETIRVCIDMGFDDVVTPPFTQSRVEERIRRQIDRTSNFYETSSYFGPDRGDRVEQRGGKPARRVQILRRLADGVTVIRDTLHAGP